MGKIPNDMQYYPASYCCGIRPSKVIKSKNATRPEAAATISAVCVLLPVVRIVFAYTHPEKPTANKNEMTPLDIGLVY